MANVDDSEGSSRQPSTSPPLAWGAMTTTGGSMRKRKVHPAEDDVSLFDSDHKVGGLTGVQRASLRLKAGTGHKYTYTVVLRNKLMPNGLSMAQLRKLQEKIVEFMVRSGLKVYVLCDDVDHDTEDALVLLLENLTDEQINEEVERLRVATFFEAGTLEEYTAEHMTRAQKLNQLHVVVDRALSRVRDNGHLFRHFLSDDDNEVAWERDVVIGQGPLHDLEFNEDFFKRFTARNTCTTLQLDPMLTELREHFGERVAFYFFFVSFYTKWLAPLALFMTLYYFCVRWSHWPSYERGLGLLGVCVPTVWATLMSIHWKRKSARLRYLWRLDDQPIPELPNPHKPKFKWVKNTITGDWEKKYDPTNNRAKIRAFTPFFTCCNMIVLVVVFVPFIQWYVYSKLVPTCECCNWYMDTGKNVSATYPPLPSECSIFKEEALINIEAGTFNEPSSCDYFMTCFDAIGGTIGTDRWVYILFQGIIVGITMDIVQFEFFAWVMERFTQLESWRTDAVYESKVITKQFYFVWLNMFFWFWWIAFVYVPFGETLQTVLRDVGLGWTVPGFGWRPGVINIDEAFVTPLIATQSINLALETIIPYCMNKKARSLHKQKMALRKKLDVDLSLKFLPRTAAGSTARSETAVDMGTEAPELQPHTPATLQRWLKKAWKGDLGLLQKYTDDSNKYDATQVMLQIDRGPWHPRIDYLDIMMQFGYVCQFTTCWALAPIPAIVNNVLEIRGDVLKIMVGHSRPVPVVEKGIGEWENIVKLAIFLSTFTSIGLIVLSTGELEYWVTPNCIDDSRLRAESLMGPDLTCFDSWGWRLAAAVVIFFMTSFVRHQIRSSVPEIDPKLAYQVRSENVLVKRKRHHDLLPTMPPQFLTDLRVLFDSYDMSGDGVLGHEECGQMFGSVNKLANAMDANVRKLTPADQESLFEVLDQDNSKSISFTEAALAVSRCQADPFLRDAVGFNLADACHVLAERMTAKLRAEQSSHGLRTTPSAQFIADTANSIIAASANVVNVPVVEDEGSESKRDAPPMPAMASLNP